MSSIVTNYKNSGGTDLGAVFVDKAYLMDRYPELVDTFKQAGLWVWGYNNNGQIGDNTITLKNSPIQTVAGGTNWKQASKGQTHTSAIKTDGTLWSWGSNIYGQLGDSTSVKKSSPVQTIAGGTNWKQVSSGYSSSAAIKTDGTLWLWGGNFFGQLGDTTNTDKSSPIQTVAAGANWKQVAVGSRNTSAIKTDGTLWIWGYNNNGQLGDNTRTSSSSPIQTVAGGTNWKQVTTGYTTTAIKTDGTLWLWGNNFNGQLGDNTTANKSSPVQTVSGGVNWQQVAGGQSHTLAIKTDGTLWAWGYNYYGQLGDNTRTNRSSPVQTVSGGTIWKQIATGNTHSFSIKTDGTLWAWGYNYNGQLGSGANGVAASKSSPVQTIAGGTNWKQIACGLQSSVAIRDDSLDGF
jgi:alpha-tubulin suppressor-like RCC1 family protein